MKQLVIYVHGKGGRAEEANHYLPLFPDCDVIGLDYQAQNPWEAKAEFSAFYDSHCANYDNVILIANSIGAYFSMCSLCQKKIAQALFISPIVNMEKLISDMMLWANITQERLETEQEIHTEFGEVLSWEYFSYVKAHPISWNIPTRILHGGKDNLTSRETISHFSDQIGAELTVMEDGEHWFHTEAQMQFLDNWIKA